MKTAEVSVVDYRNLFIHNTSPTRKCNPFAKESFKQPYQSTATQEGKFATLNYFNLISKSSLSTVFKAQEHGFCIIDLGTAGYRNRRVCFSFGITSEKQMLLRW